MALFCWHCLGLLIHLEGCVTANQYNGVTSHQYRSRDLCQGALKLFWHLLLAQHLHNKLYAMYSLNFPLITCMCVNSSNPFCCLRPPFVFMPFVCLGDVFWTYEPLWQCGKNAGRWHCCLFIRVDGLLEFSWKHWIRERTLTASQVLHTHDSLIE